jgi:hypothetical protein
VFTRTLLNATVPKPGGSTFQVTFDKPYSIAPKVCSSMITLERTLLF